MSNCQRCGRDLIDPNAQYGWRCIKKIGFPYGSVRELMKDFPEMFSLFNQLSSKSKKLFEERIRKFFDDMANSKKSIWDGGGDYMELIRDMRKTLAKEKSITKAHLDLIEKTKGLSPHKGTVEWDIVQAMIWGIDFSINGGKYEKIEPFKDQWVAGYRDVIKAAAKEYDIPEVLLAGVIHIEVGGDPLEVDDVIRLIRILGLDPKGKEPNETSFGNTSVQVSTAAEMLGYDFKHLTAEQTNAIIASIKDPVQGIFITAMYLSHLRNRDFAGKKGKDLTEDDISVLASRYNLGPSTPLSKLGRDNGNKVINMIPKLKKLLGIG